MLFSKAENQKGITLIETIVALAIVSIGLVSGLSLALMSTARATDAKEKLIAMHLAQEGLELARSERDAEGLAGLATYDIDTYADYISRFAASSGDSLWIDDQEFYRQQASYGDPVPTRATIYTREISRDGDTIISEVQWSGGAKSVKLKLVLPMWRNQP